MSMWEDEHESIRISRGRQWREVSRVNTHKQAQRPDREPLEDGRNCECSLQVEDVSEATCSSQVDLESHFLKKQKFSNGLSQPLYRVPGTRRQKLAKC